MSRTLPQAFQGGQANLVASAALQHVGMYEQKWVPFNGNPHQEVVVNEISTCSALVIVVGSRGAAAAHLTPDPKWWREEIEATIRHARQHHQAGDMCVSRPLGRSLVPI